jgi:hypothetical protein
LADLSSGQSLDGGLSGGTPDASSLIFFSRTISETADIFQKTLRDDSAFRTIIAYRKSTSDIGNHFKHKMLTFSGVADLDPV